MEMRNGAKRNYGVTFDDVTLEEAVAAGEALRQGRAFPMW